MKIRYITNIPSPYKINFFNELGKKSELEVIFEAEKAPKINNNWYKDNNVKNFKAIFLKRGEIKEKKIDFSISKHIKKNADLIVFTNYSYYTELFAILIAKIKKIKYAMQIDGGMVNHSENWIKKILKKKLIKGASFYLSPSKVSDDFLRYYDVDIKKIYRYPFTSIENKEILTKEISVNEKEKLRKKNNLKEKKIILSVGQYIYRKGFDWMIEAFKDVDKDVGIYIVGGEPTAEYKTLKEKYNMTNLHFIEFLDKKQILEWYRLADVFVLPTRWDIWGLVVNEALSQALPVITTDKCVSGQELIKNGENGYLVEVEDKKNLRKVVEEILNMKEKDYVLMCKQCINIISEYSIENMSETIFKIILNQRGSKK